MYVVGTAGHIDHGKTSLILALTGTDCDRLPEEKERRMTIDLGFAGMEVPGFGTVGFIDVPGHERYIRNMVAGAWGMDLGLLVVAADDGWMPQTEDHFQVLALLGVERIIVVLTKIDIADPAADRAEEDAERRLSGTAYAGALRIRVSAKTGEGIGALKTAIAENLKRLLGARDARKPYLCVDRVFAARGHGTVVTGTLRNGTLRENDPVRILPGGREARIKKIESHHSAQAEGGPSRRTALNLTGVSVEELRRGSIVCREQFFTEAREIVAGVRILDRSREMKNNQGTEILIGTAALPAKIIFITDDKKVPSLLPVRIKFDADWYCYPGQRFIITGPGGHRILGGGTVLYPGYDRKLKERIRGGLSVFHEWSDAERVLYIISIRRWMRIADLQGMLPDNRERVEDILRSLREGGRIALLDGYAATVKDRDEAVRAVRETIRHNRGLNLKELSDRAQVDFGLCRLLMDAVRAPGSIDEKNGRYYWENSDAADSLTKKMKDILERARLNGSRGIELDRITDESEKRDSRELIGMGKLVVLEGNILYHRDIYDELKMKIMTHIENRQKLSIADAKEATGLSRKYLIPLLNRMERDKLLKRLGDFRIKI